MKRAIGAIGLSILLFSPLEAGDSADQSAPWPRRVVITNDNGIDDAKIVALARAFSRVAETYVVAPLADRSGSGSYISIERRPEFEVERRDLGPGITTYALDGYPADCVIFGALGLLRERRPDLVVAGINGGPNLGHTWFGSGTIGAARIAAFAGIPAIAVSGMDAEIPGALSAAADWVVRFAQSRAVAELKKGEYFTVSLPRLPPERIQGVQVVARNEWHLHDAAAVVPLDPAALSQARQRWTVRPAKQSGGRSAAEDEAAYEKGYIAIVPMNVDEVDHRRVQSLREKIDTIPVWSTQRQR